MEQISFKNKAKEYVKNEVVPLLQANGFSQVSRMKYVREKDGLLQYFYFRVEKYKLRPWFYFLPMFEERNDLLVFGSDHIYVQDVLSPYYGYGNVCIGTALDGNVSEREYSNKILPELEALKKSIQNGILPFMNDMDSLDKFVQCCCQNERILGYDWGREAYFTDYVLPIFQNSGLVGKLYLKKKRK